MARVLVAERDQRIRALIAGILREFGHEVAACADGAEATKRLAADPVDVVVSDLVLCRVEGVGLGRQWAALGIPTITLTGREFHADQPPRDRPAPLVDKPFRFTDLLTVVNAVAGYPLPEIRDAA